MKSTSLQAIKIIIFENFKELQQFIKSSSFSKAILIAIAITLPIGIGIYFGYFEIGLAVCLGAFWSSPSDVSGSFRHKKIGILISAALIMVVSFIGGYLDYNTWFTLPILGVLSFGIAFISVYGFRASLISFSGLMALILSIANDTEELEIYQQALLIGVGGLWYLLLATIRQSINPKAETEEFLSETYRLTAEFIETRAKLVSPNEDHNELQTKLQQLQSELTENHANLREILLYSRKSSGWSNYQDKRLLVFVQLVDMLETAIANPVNYDKLNLLLKEQAEFAGSFQKLIFEMARQLQLISEARNNPKKIPNSSALAACFKEVENQVSALGTQSLTSNYENFLMLQNLLEYQEKQFEKLKKIKWLLGDPEIDSDKFINRDNSKRFLVRQDYDLLLLVRNLSFRSTIFRHSLRLSVTLMIGYILGNLFPFQNSYWILLTIIVILRPSYGLTKARSKDRIIGTLIGGIIAVGVVYLIQNPYVYGALGVITLVISFSMIQKNYKAAATFITLSVIFIYAIVQEDILSVIKFRILDTLVGASLSYIAMLWLWPSWESIGIKESIEKSIQANKNFLHKISDFYQQKGSVPTSYNIARKEAFLETSNLSSAFQRMAQEPKSKQKAIDKIHELVVLNHSFLASLSSLSAYMQHHKTTEASKKFIKVAAKIEHNLEQALNCLKDNKFGSIEDFDESDLLINYKEQLLAFDNLENKGETVLRNLQEAHLIWEQLQWLHSLSSKMLKLSLTVKQH